MKSTNNHSALCVVVSLLLLIIGASCSSNERYNALEIGGFKFGSSKQEALNLAASYGYKIEPIGAYRLWLTGNIHALDLSWDKMDICVDSVNGIKEIVLTRKYSETTPEMMDKHFNAIKKLYPQSSRQAYTTAITVKNEITGQSSTITEDYASIFELIDDKDEYTGSSYFIISRDQFSTLIDLRHTKDFQ